MIEPIPGRAGRSRWLRVLCLAGTVGLSGCFLLPEEPIELRVTIEGNGRVFSFGLDFNCTTPLCTVPLHRAAEGGEFVVHHEPRAGWDFAQWTGRCAGVTDTMCRVDYAAGTTGEEVGIVFVPE